MVERNSKLNAVFQALADSTRRKMLESLADGDRTIVELAKPFDMSLAGASKHVQVLERAGLISRRKQGRSHICQLNARAFKEAQLWLVKHERLWNSRLDRLEELLKAEKKTSRKPKGNRNG